MEAAAEMPPPRRRVTVRTATIDVMAAPPGAVELAVSDEAAGLKAAEIERAGEPFYTTKPDGMGLGLSICCSILQSHHSRLEVLSHEGPGTTFRFLLPVSAKESHRG